MAIKSISIRIDSDLLDKLHVVADYEGRSANSELCRCPPGLRNNRPVILGDSEGGYFFFLL